MSFGANKTGAVAYAAPSSAVIEESLSLEASGAMTVVGTVVTFGTITFDASGAMDPGDPQIEGPDALSLTGNGSLSVFGKVVAFDGVRLNAAGDLSLGDVVLRRKIDFDASGNLNTVGYVVSVATDVDVETLPIISAVDDGRSALTESPNEPDLYPSQVFVYEQHFLDVAGEESYRDERQEDPPPKVLRGTVELSTELPTPVLDKDVIDALHGEVGLSTSFDGTLRL